MEMTPIKEEELVKVIGKSSPHQILILLMGSLVLSLSDVPFTEPYLISLIGS